MSSPKKANLTPRDLDYIVIALQSLKGNTKLEIDYEKMANATGLKNAKTACAVWTPIKNKLFDRDGFQVKTGTATGSTSPAGVKKRTGNKKGGKKAKADEDASESADKGQQEEKVLGEGVVKVEVEAESKAEVDTQA